MSAATSRRSAPRSRAMSRASPVDDFQLVKAGDLLVEIDDQDYRARVAQAEADVLGAEAAIENLKARKALQHAQIDQAAERHRRDPGRCRSHQAGAEPPADPAGDHLSAPPRRSSRPSPTKSASRRPWPATRPSSRAQRRQMAVLDTQESAAARRGQGQERGARPRQDQSRLYPDHRAGRRHGRRARGARRASISGPAPRSSRSSRWTMSG